MYDTGTHTVLCLQGSDDLCMCCGQVDMNIAHILLFLDDLLILYSQLV